MVDVNLSSEVELFVSCRNLPNKDTFSLTDPFVVVEVFNSDTQKYIEVGRTETIAYASPL